MDERTSNEEAFDRLIQFLVHAYENSNPADDDDDDWCAGLITTSKDS